MLFRVKMPRRLPRYTSAQLNTMSIAPPVMKPDDPFKRYFSVISPQPHHPDPTAQRTPRQEKHHEVVAPLSIPSRNNFYQSITKNRTKYVRDLKHRLDRSWAAGLQHFYAESENLVPKSEVMYILRQSLEVLRKEPNVLSVNINTDDEQPSNSILQNNNKSSSEEYDNNSQETVGENGNEEQKMTVVGDTHGQFYDVLNILEINGEPSASNKYVFNGDFVDRGSFSFQVIFLLLVYKTLFPHDCYLLRGNHETIEMNMMYGFAHEILAKYDNEVLKMFWEVFESLPLAAVLTNHTYPRYRTLVLHGGLFREDWVSLKDINAIDRRTVLTAPSVREKSTGEEKESKLSREGEIVHDMLWADPMKSQGRKENVARMGGLMFGPDVTSKFLVRNGLNLLVRSHQVRKRGWSSEHNGRCITVFSAPNYCDMVDNKGAFLNFSNEKPEPKIFEFEAVRHPPLEPMVHLHLFRGIPKF